jgi:hypothetical protein
VNSIGTRDVAGEVLERFRVLVVAGISVGALVVGVGSRLAMFVLRLTSPDQVRGRTSDDGFIIGRFTLSGSYNLLLLGAAIGIIGAAAYRAVAPWLLGPTWFRRFTTAAASGAVVGSMLVHADGIDFQLLKPLWLAIGLFVALPAVFAIAIGVAVDRVAAPDSWTTVGRRRWVLPVLLIAAFPPALFILVPALLVLSVWVPARRSLSAAGDVPWVLGLAVRGVWLAIAVGGIVALMGDIGDLT